MTREELIKTIIEAALPMKIGPVGGTHGELKRRAEAIKKWAPVIKGGQKK